MCSSACVIFVFINITNRRKCQIRAQKRYKIWCKNKFSLVYKNALHPMHLLNIIFHDSVFHYYNWVMGEGGGGGMLHRLPIVLISCCRVRVFRRPPPITRSLSNCWSAGSSWKDDLSAEKFMVSEGICRNWLSWKKWSMFFVFVFYHYSVFI